MALLFIFLPSIFLSFTFIYATIKQWLIFRSNKKLVYFYLFFAFVLILFAGLTLNISYFSDSSDFIPYYILITAGAILLNIYEHNSLKQNNIKYLYNIVLNVFSFFLVFVFIFFHGFLLISNQSDLDLLKDHYYFFIFAFIVIYLLFYFILRIILSLNVKSQMETINIIQEIQSGKLPVPKSQPQTLTSLTECQSIPFNLLKITGIIKKHQETSIEQMNKLKEVDRLRGEFLRNVSHELRTPLTIILGYINLISIKLKKEKLDSLHAYSENVKAQASILQRLVENILSFSKMEKKTMELFISLIDVSSTFQKLINEYGPIIKHMELNIKTQIAPFKIYADSDKIYTVFRELMSNATKFTPKGGNILLKSEIIEQQDGDIARFILQDSGIGIPEEKIEQSFHKFKQIDGEASREYGGTGMGLPLCKGIVELHNGKITIKSKQNHGTRVIIDIPQKKGVIKRISVPEIPKFIDKDKNYFLIIEDDPLIADLIKTYLEMHNIEGISLNSGRDAVKVIRTIKPIGITLDINLPDMDGWKVIDKIRKSDLGDKIPIIVITEGDDKYQAMKKGIKMYLEKPIDKDLFDTYLLKVLSDRSRAIQPRTDK